MCAVRRPKKTADETLAEAVKRLRDIEARHNAAEKKKTGANRGKPDTKVSDDARRALGNVRKAKGK